jgi:hypothetical protein
VSYDWDGYPPPPPERGVRAWISRKYWGFVIWCRLDSGIGFLERWAERRMGI